MTFLSADIILNIKKGKKKEVLTRLISPNIINLQETVTGDTALHVAIAFHKDQIAKELLKQSAINLNLRNVKGQTPLHIAIWHKNVIMLNNLLKQKNQIDYSIVDMDGNNVFHYAAIKNLPTSTIKKLYTVASLSGINSQKLLLDKTISSGNTPLHCAVEHGAIPKGKSFILIDLNINALNIQNNKNELPFMTTLRVGNDLLGAILFNKTDMSLYNTDKLLIRIVKRNLVHTLHEILLKSFGIRQSKSNCPSCTQNEPEQPNQDHWVQWNERQESDGNTVILLATLLGHVDILKVLLFYSQFNVTLSNYNGDNILHLAFLHQCKNDVLEVVLEWLEKRRKYYLSQKIKRASTETLTHQNNTCNQILTWDIICDSIINYQNHQGKTPLHCLLDQSELLGEKKTLNIIKRLYKLQADINIADSNGETPLFIAVKAQYTSIVNQLRLYGAKVDFINNLGFSTVEIALQFGNIALVNSLTCELHIKK